jgi:hypothetical protein
VLHSSKLAPVTTSLDWTLAGVSVLLVLLYELFARHRRHTRPLAFARTAHAKIRADWARAIRRSPGHEVLAVQTLRNSVMASSITASTAVLAFVALVSQISPQDRAAVAQHALDMHAVLVILLMAVLFAAFMLSAVSVRFFNHAGYMLATPLSSGGDELTELGARYVATAGHLYSLSLRSFLFAAPLVIGLASRPAMLVAAIALVGVLVWFDRPPPLRQADAG